MDNGHSDTVYYFINNLKIDIKQFNEVILKIVLCLYIFSVLLGGVALYNNGWGYYSNNYYILCVFRN